MATAICIEVAGISWSTPPEKSHLRMDDELGNLPEGRSRFDVPESTMAVKGDSVTCAGTFDACAGYHMRTGY